jgi:para-nitrobenzyl esterase
MVFDRRESSYSPAQVSRRPIQISDVEFDRIDRSVAMSKKVFNKFSRSIASMAFGVAFFTAISVPAVNADSKSESSTALVRTQQGSAQGVAVGGVEQFLGLPYGAPPVGDLRWKAPAPPKPYTGTLQATTFPAPCIQGNAPAGFPPPSEDCLYLNLYRPAGSKEGKKMPVLMYIHGGGFGGGTASLRDGMELVSGNDMIVITINYRLGALGWLALAGLDAESPAGSSSGNYGFLDMLAALRWVQDNITAFGGDKNNVTLAGTSAGGIGVCTLMTAPLHDRPFQKAIIESGECTTTSAYIISHQTALLQGANFAAKLGCTDSATFTSCLRSKPAPALVEAMRGLGMFTANIGGNLMPVAPIKVIESGQMERMPVIVGSTHDEQRRSGVMTTGFPGTEQGYQKYLTASFGPLAPLVAAQYPSSAFKDPAYAAGAAASDSGIPNGIGVCPMLSELSGAFSKVTKTFAYELNDPHGSGLPDSAGFEPGSMHTSEIGFLYDHTASEKHTPEQNQLATRMQHYWATFARTGRPMDGTHEWPALQPGSDNILRFQPSGDVMVTASAVSSEHRCSFWSGLGY